MILHLLYVIFIILYVTFLLTFFFCFFFSIDFYNFYRIMSRGEEYLRDFFWNNFWCLLCWFSLFLALTNFQPMFSVIWCCSLALALRRIQFSDLANKLAESPLCGMQEANRAESNETSDSKLVVCHFFAYLSLTFFIIYLFKTL